jgi:hypothetical protein
MTAIDKAQLITQRNLVIHVSMEVSELCLLTAGNFIQHILRKLWLFADCNIHGGLAQVASPGSTISC